MANPLVRAVARVPISVQRKLLIAFGIVVVLLVVVGFLGLRVLNDSNTRAQALGQLPQRLVAYRGLQFDGEQLSSLQVDRNYDITCLNVASVASLCGGLSTTPVTVAGDDGAITATLQLIAPYANINTLGFAPAPAERTLLGKINSEYTRLSGLMAGLVAGDQAGRFVGSPSADFLPGNPLSYSGDADLIAANATQLVTITQTAADNLIAQNQAAYVDSQRLFFGVAAGSAVLALLLGVILSGAIVGPIKQVRGRLTAIASGDFTTHIDARNRDELGALAADVNRMNDKLGRLYRELETTSRHKSEFLANMSHELRTPLNAVIGFSDVLLQGLFGELNAKQTEYITDINTSGKHLLTLINDILDLSKIEAGRMDLQVSSFDLPDLLRNSVSLLRERATRQRISLQLEVAADVGVVEADERLLKQVLFNLLSNALKFTADGGHVEVSARSAGDDVEVSVRDDGAGIAPADQERIFQEFEQAGKNGLHEGTGLGLALARRFVELHGGELRVESAIGAGSTFTFTIPKHRPRADVGLEAVAHPDAAGAPVRAAPRS